MVTVSLQIIQVLVEGIYGDLLYNFLLEPATAEKVADLHAVHIQRDRLLVQGSGREIRTGNEIMITCGAVFTLQPVSYTAAACLYLWIKTPSDIISIMLQSTTLCKSFRI